LFSCAASGGAARPVWRGAAGGAEMSSTSSRPGRRALHQDNFYLRVKPDTCIAAWVAVDPAVGAENGGLVVVPGSNRGEVFCPERAITSPVSFMEYVKLPAGLVWRRRWIAGGRHALQRQPDPRLRPNSSPDQFRRPSSSATV